MAKKTDKPIIEHINDKIDEKITLGDNIIRYRNRTSYHMPLHNHDALQILIPLEGSHYEIAWALDNKETESKVLGVADICLIPPFLEHEVRWAHCANFISLYITSAYMDTQLEQGFDPQTHIIEAHIGFDDPMLYTLAQSLAHYLRTSACTNQTYFNALLIVVSQHIVSHYLRAEVNTAPFSHFEQVPCHKMRTAMLFIQNNLDRPLSIGEIADSIDMSHYHFMRTFKETVGIPASRFHMKQRIEKAKELLKKQRPIIEVALDLGFSSQSHFSHVFTKAVGVTPRRYARASL